MEAERWHIDKTWYRGVVARLITSRMGAVEDVEPLHTWGPTVVMWAGLSSGRQVVCKASARQDVHAEAAACELARDAGVMAPPVLAVGDHERLPGRRWYLMPYVDGQPWSSLPREPTADLAVVDQLAGQFAALHSVPAVGIGRLRSDGTAAGDFWPDWIWSTIDGNLDRLAVSGVDVSRLRRLCDVVRRESYAHLGQRPAALLHADLGDGEVLLRDANVIGVVDWGAAMFGDPLYDFARFVAGGRADDPRPDRWLPRLRRRYEELTQMADEEVFALYRAHNAIDNAVWSVDEGLDWSADLVSQAERWLRDGPFGAG